MRAASLAAELEEALGIGSEVKPGGRGQFDVIVDGETVFSKHTKGRFPEEGEVPRLLAGA